MFNHSNPPLARPGIPEQAAEAQAMLDGAKVTNDLQEKVRSGTLEY